MASKRLVIPEAGRIYRGADWTLRINWDWDASAITFTLRLAPTLNTATGLISTAGPTGTQATEPRFTVFTLDKAVTAAIATSVTSLEYDIRGNNDTTYYDGVIPVRGQVGT